MNRTARITAIALASACAVWLVAQVQPQTGPALDAVFPPGPAIYVEARDLSALVRDWNASPEKLVWLKSANYTVFSRTRLFQRLADAQTEFSAAAGFTPDYPFAASIAGGESAIAMYDIGKLEFLYITRLPSARVLETALGKVRSSYDSRSVAGQTYYLRENREYKRITAFAAANGLLLLATREDLMAQALTLLATKQGTSLRGEPWYQNATAASKAKGEIRIAMNFRVLLEAPQFRAYWVQRNAAELKQFASGIADLFREGAGFREERVFLREQQAESKAGGEAALAGLIPFVPTDAGLYRGWVQPSTAQVSALLTRKILAPGPAAGPSDFAPAAAAPADPAGSEADLETRIDQPPLTRADGPAERAIETLLAKQPVEAMLHVQGSKTLPDGVFVVTPAAVVLLGKANWDEAGLRAAFAEARIAVRGAVAVLSNDETMLNAITARLNSPPAPAAGSYVAEFRHTQELPRFTRQMRLIDAQRAPHDPAQLEAESNEGREPEFFAENVSSLGRVLNRYATVTFVMHDDGMRVPQTVHYRFSNTR